MGIEKSHGLGATTEQCNHRCPIPDRFSWDLQELDARLNGL